jgi:hypothetical protein
LWDDWVAAITITSTLLLLAVVVVVIDFSIVGVIMLGQKRCRYLVARL